MSQTGLARAKTRDELSKALLIARRILREDPDRALQDAVSLYVQSSELGDPALMSRALAVQGQVAVHLGDVRGALELAFEAANLLDGVDSPVALAEMHSLKSHVSYFEGSFTDALGSAHRAIRFADVSGDVHLRLFVRRNSSLVFGTAELSDVMVRLRETVDIAVESADHWEEAAARNDLGWTLAPMGSVDEALTQLELADAAGQRTKPNNFIRGVIAGSMAEVLLIARRPEEALSYADESRRLLEQSGPVSPYMFSGTVSTQVQVRTALGLFDDARDLAEQALRKIGEAVPRINGEMFAALAQTLRAAGQLEEAYEALARSAEIERAAFRELEHMRLNLERATLEATVLRDQLERDWLTGLYNRRFLAREMSDREHRRFGWPLTVAVVDIDNFKRINDTYGHDAGDQVLVRLAGLMRGTIRPLDAVVRNGGEEFLLVMPVTAAVAGTAISERMRRAIQSHNWDDIRKGLQVTASIGVITSHEPVDFDELVKAADRNLYAAKRGGRNRVVTGTPMPPRHRAR